MNNKNKNDVEVEIRTATIDDLADIFHLGEIVFTSQEVSNLYRTWDEYEVTHLYNSEAEYMLVAIVDDVLVGFALGTTIEKNRSAWNYGHLLWLGGDPDYGRLGVASQLFERFKELMVEANVRMLLVDTQADNDGAIRFFHKKGFTNPVDHVYMTMKLRNKSNKGSRNS
ncbi:MAG: GNAT family N-acetyltransferase [Phycisphaerae bacterium]|nr:GNAT family N-acetyltransferase [Phycisphaerae bacterium]